MLPFDPSSDPVILRLLSTLFERPPALFIFVQRCIFRRCPNIILQDLANLPFDQLAVQTESQLAEHFYGKVSAAIVRSALHGLRRRLGMNPRTGIAPVGSEGKRTLIDSLAIPASAGFEIELRIANRRIAEAWKKLPESDAVFLRFFRKHEELLLNLLRSWTRGRDESLVKDIAQFTWHSALLLFDPARQWSFKFIERIARNLLRDEWTRRRKWRQVHFLESLRNGDDEEASGFNTELPARPPASALEEGFAEPGTGDESTSFQPLAAWEEALRAIMTGRGRPIHRAMFIAIALLGHTPRTLVRDHSKTLLADFVDALEAEFAWKSNLTDELVAELFKPLRRDLARVFLHTAPNKRRLVGATRIGEYFSSRDVTRQANELSRWAENAKRQLWSQAGNGNTVLFRQLQEVNPDWKPKRRPTGTKGKSKKSNKSRNSKPPSTGKKRRRPRA